MGNVKFSDFMQDFKDYSKNSMGWYIPDVNSYKKENGQNRVRILPRVPEGGNPFCPILVFPFLGATDDSVFVTINHSNNPSPLLAAYNDIRAVHGNKIFSGGPNSKPVLGNSNPYQRYICWVLPRNKPGELIPLVMDMSWNHYQTILALFIDPSAPEDRRIMFDPFDLENGADFRFTLHKAQVAIHSKYMAFAFDRPSPPAASRPADVARLSKFLEEVPIERVIRTYTPEEEEVAAKQFRSRFEMALSGGGSGDPSRVGMTGGGFENLSRGGNDTSVYQMQERLMRRDVPQREEFEDVPGFEKIPDTVPSEQSEAIPVGNSIEERARRIRAAAAKMQ